MQLLYVHPLFYRLEDLMQINFYDARIADNDRTILVKEKDINYEYQNMDSPKEISLMLKRLLHMDENPVPSECDVELTKRLKAGGELLNICLADHIIIGHCSYLSFKEAKLL